jgi:hypothetical protein
MFGTQSSAPKLRHEGSKIDRYRAAHIDGDTDGHQEHDSQTGETATDACDATGSGVGTIEDGASSAHGAAAAGSSTAGSICRSDCPAHTPVVAATAPSHAAAASRKIALRIVASPLPRITVVTESSVAPVVGVHAAWPPTTFIHDAMFGSCRP